MKIRTKLFALCAALAVSLTSFGMLAACGDDSSIEIVNYDDNTFVSYTLDDYDAITDSEWEAKEVYYQFEGAKDETENVPVTGIPDMNFNVLATLYSDGSVRVFQFSVQAFDLRYYGYWWNETETDEIAVKIMCMEILYYGNVLASMADCEQSTAYCSLTDGTDEDGYDYYMLLPLTYFGSYASNMGLYFETYGIQGTLVEDLDAWFTEHTTGTYTSSSSSSDDTDDEDDTDNEDVTAVAELTGTIGSMVLYSDGSYTFSYDSSTYGGMDFSESGSWSYADSVLTVTQSDGTEITATADDDGNLTFYYTPVTYSGFTSTFTVEASALA